MEKKKCGEKCEVYSRCCGYIRPVTNWNRGKREEFKDRYGPLPAPVSNLLEIQRLRIRAGKLGIVEVRGGRQGCDFFFAGGREPAPPIIQGLMASGPKGLQFKAVDQFIMKVPAHREEHLAVAEAVTDRLASLQGISLEG